MQEREACTKLVEDYTKLLERQRQKAEQDYKLEQGTYVDV